VSPSSERFTLFGPNTRSSPCLWILEIRRGYDKSLAFPIFLFAAQPKEFVLDGLKKLEQRSHKCVELRGEYVE
jgi:hypothetical protein